MPREFIMEKLRQDVMSAYDTIYTAQRQKLSAKLSARLSGVITIQLIA